MDAGVRLLAQLRFEEILAAVDTRAVAESADVTTGSFFHHFRSREHYADAVVERWTQLWSERVQRLAAFAVQAADDSGHGGLRNAAVKEWEALSRPGLQEALQRMLWAVRAQPLTGRGPRTAGDALRAGYVELSAAVRPHYERGLRGLGREPLPPFTSHDLEVLTTALAEGLQLRVGADPDAIRPHLYGDAIAALLLGATRPRVERGTEQDGVDLAVMERRLGGTAEPLPDDGSVERWRTIADAAAHLFVDRSPSDVRLSEVAAAAGLGRGIVQHEFDSVQAVAAASWVRHVPELEAIATPPLGPDEDPMRRIEAVLLRYVELLRGNLGAAEALVGEILRSMRPGAEVRRDLRRLVPLPALLEPHVEELRRRGRLRRRVEFARLARSLVQLVTMQATLFPEDSPARIVDETMTMTFDGALVEPSDA